MTFNLYSIWHAPPFCPCIFACCPLFSFLNPHTQSVFISLNLLKEETYIKTLLLPHVSPLSAPAIRLIYNFSSPLWPSSPVWHTGWRLSTGFGPVIVKTGGLTVDTSVTAAILVTAVTVYIDGGHICMWSNVEECMTQSFGLQFCF